MSISAQQCRAARGLFAMTQQELSNASGVSVRTIASFEDAGDRYPVAGNLAAIRRALEELGVVFTAQGVAWSSPFPIRRSRPSAPWRSGRATGC